MHSGELETSENRADDACAVDCGLNEQFGEKSNVGFECLFEQGLKQGFEVEGIWISLFLIESDTEKFLDAF